MEQAPRTQGENELTAASLDFPLSPEKRNNLFEERNPGLSPEEIGLVERTEASISNMFDELVNDAWQEPSKLDPQLGDLISQLAELFSESESDFKVGAATRAAASGEEKMYRWWSHVFGKISDRLKTTDSNDRNNKSLPTEDMTVGAAALDSEYIAAAVSELLALLKDSTKRKGEKEWGIRRPRKSDLISSLFRGDDKSIIGKLAENLSIHGGRKQYLRREIGRKKATLIRVFQEKLGEMSDSLNS